MRNLVVATVPLALALAGCESSARLSDASYAPGLQAEAPAPGIAAPTTRVTSSPLPPIASSPLPPSDPAPLGSAPAGDQVAALPPPTAPVAAPVAPAVPRARGLAGTWKISDAARGDCSIALTQTPLLDLYRASPAGCQAGSLAKVDAWQQRGQEIVLLEPGGRTAVRLFPKGDGTYEGSATTSGAVIRMSR